VSPALETFADRSAASHAAAEVLAAALARHLGRSAEAGLAVSGGKTPRQCLGQLADHRLDWGRVRVTVTDERCVPADDPDSNEGMVRRQLLVGPAAAARFLRLPSPELRAFSQPFACVLVGMGEDGHFASVFPDADNLDEALDLANTACCLPVRTAASPHPRVSMTLARLVRSDEVVLLAFGTAKRRVLDAPQGYPVGRLLAQTRAPVRLMWAP
jgi:6-phosphogluconolactonase